MVTMHLRNVLVTDFIVSKGSFQEALHQIALSDSISYWRSSSATGPREPAGSVHRFEVVSDRDDVLNQPVWLNIFSGL